MTEQLATYTGSALDPANYSHSWTVAQQLAKSDLLPPHFKGKPENVLLVLALAQQLDVNPIMALQQVSVIGQKPCLQASLMIALLNKSGLIRGPLQFEYSGDPGQPARSCSAYATDSDTGEVIRSEPVSLAMAQAEGWTRNPKYRSMPDVMLKWRAASFFVRTYYPQVVLGLHTAEEVEDVVTTAGPASSSNGHMSAREKLAARRAETQPETQPEAQPDPPTVDVETSPVAGQNDNSPSVVVGAFETAGDAATTPPPPDQTPDEVLTDLLAGVLDADADRLTLYVPEVNLLESEASKKIASRAIRERAKVLGVKWDKARNAFA